jgi:PIN domain nuclease of toxin-antitoxin system
MRILLDTHHVIELVDDVVMRLSEPGLLQQAQADGELVASTVSLWEAEIKSRLGKLPLSMGVQAWPGLLETANVRLLSVLPSHVLARIEQEPQYKDPFDRALLSAAAAEGLKLLAKDRILQSHPLA